VVELGALPGRGGMTRSTLLGETRRQVTGRGCRLVLHGVARNAFLRGSREASTHVALLATRGNVSSSQCKPAETVIECCALPARFVVTRGAVRWKTRSLVIRIRSVVEVRPVTRNAVRRGAGKFAADMTRCTLRNGMSASERKFGAGVMVEACGLP
jgi:hypothetical protein